MKVKIIAWGLLAVLLGLAVCSFLLRWNNERANREIVTVVDFHDFYLFASHANRDINDVLLELQEAGVQSVAIRELSVRDMAHRGVVAMQPFGLFWAETRVDKPALFELLSATIEGAVIGRDNFVVVSADLETTEFLYTRLAARYVSPSQAAVLGSVPEFFHLNFQENDYFVMNFEHIGQHWGEGRVIDFNLGFDEPLMARLTDMGFSIVLRPGISRGGNDLYWEEYDYLIEKFGIRQIVFVNAVFDGSPEHVQKAAELIERHELIVGIIETPLQVEFFFQEGLPQLMGLIHYQVNRLYSTSNDEFVATISDRYHRWTRSIVDRNIRMLYVVPFRENAESASGNLDNTIQIISEFVETAEGMGYTFVPYLRPLNTSTPRTLNRIAIGLSLAVAGGLYLTYLFKLKAAHTLIITGIAAALAFGMNLVTGLLPLEISLIYALGAALIYPTFSSLLMLLYLRNYKHHIFVLKLVFVLGILFAVNGLAMYTIVSSMADIRFIMNIITYRGVQLSLIVPLAMFGFNYLIVFNDEDNIIQTVRKFLMKSPNYLILGLGVVGMGFLYIHLARSGHTTAITPSTLELRMREILEALFVARPRFREIIFGYPALAVMIYLYHKYKQNLILLGLGFGVMLGVTSMVNSFCHGFTSIYISMHRTLGGLILGGLIASGVLIGVIIAEKLLIFAYKKYYLPSVKDSVKDKEVGECL